MGSKEKADAQQNTIAAALDLIISDKGQSNKKARKIKSNIGK
jgi:hypothetical protein